MRFASCLRSKRIIRALRVLHIGVADASLKNTRVAILISKHKTKAESKRTPLLFCLFPPLSSHQRHPRATDGADRREALTANFSVSLAKCGVLNTARKICQIDACVNFVNLRVSLLCFFDEPIQSPTPHPLPLKDRTVFLSPSRTPEGGVGKKSSPLYTSKCLTSIRFRDIINARKVVQ